MKAFRKTIFNILSVVLLVLFTAYAIHLYRLGMFSSLENFRNFILSKGKLAPLAFMLVNIIQVALPIIPGGPVLIFGVVIFGAFWGFIYNYLSICVGCIIVFIISKTFGKNAVIRIFGRILTTNTTTKSTTSLMRDFYFGRFYFLLPQMIFCATYQD